MIPPWQLSTLRGRQSYTVHYARATGVSFFSFIWESRGRPTIFDFRTGQGTLNTCAPSVCVRGGGGVSPAVCPRSRSQSSGKHHSPLYSKIIVDMHPLEDAKSSWCLRGISDTHTIPTNCLQQQSPLLLVPYLKGRQRRTESLPAFSRE